MRRTVADADAALVRKDHLRRAARNEWALIIDEMRAIISTYNAAVGSDALTLVENANGLEPPTVTVRVGGDDGAALIASVDGTVICIAAHDENGHAIATQRSLCSDETTAASAAYVLKNWMEHL